MAKRRLIRRAAWLLGPALVGVSLLWWWIPWDVDLAQRLPREPNPPLDPDSARLFSKGARVLVVTAHPDDEAFYIGGVLTQLGRAGAIVRLIAVTDGDKTYYGPFTDAAANRKVRRAETEASVAKFMGESVVFLGYPDGRVRDTAELRSDIGKQITAFRPDYLLTFDDLYPTRISHSDHRRVGEATVAAAEATGFQGWIMRFMTGAPNYWRDVTDDWPAKQDLLATHASQFFGDRLTRIDGMVRGTAERHGRSIGVPLAEAFRTTH